MAVQIQFRRGTAAEWSSANPLLAQGEMGLEWDTNKFKIGTGSTYWNSLGYSSGQTGATGPAGPSGSSNAMISANQGSIITSSTSYINFTGAGVTASAIGGSVTITISGGAGSINSASLGGLPASSYALLAGSNFTSASIGGLSVATQNYVTGLGYQTSSGSVAYATNSGSSTYAASAGAAPIPASVSYSASSGVSNNSVALGGQTSSYYAPISSPTFTGTPLAPTAASATNTTQIANTAFVRGEISNLVNSAPTTLDTLNELAAALGNDPNFATTTASSIGLKAPIANPTFTGTVNLGTNVATGSVATAVNSASLNNQPGSYYYPASSITTASVAYANNSASLGGITAASYAQLVSPTFTGTPLAPTAASTVSNTQIATTAFVKNLVNSQAAVNASVGYYGAFSSSTTQTTTANVGKAIVLEQNDGANGVSIDSSSIIFQYPGVYNIQWSGQFESTSNSDQDVDVWVRANGTNVLGSDGVISIPARHGSVNGHTVVGWNYIFNVNAGDVYQFYWMPDSALVTLKYYAPSGSVPGTQSAIVTAQLVTYIQQGSSISGGSATNVTFINGTANFNSASISGSALATQSYVTGQGYQTSTGSVSYATNSGNSSSTSQTNFSALTISGSSVATQSFVNNKIYNQVIPFSVTGSVSAAGPWDYRFYNDTGGTRSINGVRASLGSAPSGSAMKIDIRKNGIDGSATIFTASGFSIPSGSITSGLIASGFNSGSSVASGDYLTVAVTQVGSASAGSDLVVQVMWS